MSTVYNPFRDMDRVFTQLARTAATEARTMPMDLYRDGDEFVVKIDLPGVDPDSIDIDVDDRTLSVRAEREQEHAHDDECAAFPRHGVRLVCHLHHPSM